MTNDKNVQLQEQNGVFSNFTSEIVSEEALSQKPTKKDMKDVYTILDDFMIEGVIIPDFETRLELQKWLRQKIKERLK